MGEVIGLLGWSEEQFWDSDIPTLSAALKAKRDHDAEAIKASWEQARWIVSVLMAPHNKGRAMKPDKLIEFPWDEKPQRTRPQDYEYVKKKLGAI